VSGDDRGARRNYNVATVGGDLYNIATYDAFGFAHETTVGGDLFHDRVNTRDDLGLASDSTPPGERLVYGAFVAQSAERGWFEATGAIRFDGYHLTGTDTYSGTEVDKTGTGLSPKITLGVTPVDAITVYASYSEAYRSPSLTETLIQGFHPPPVTFAFLPNPNLDPETAHNVEAGLNLRLDGLVTADDRLGVKAALFNNRIDDYIGLECSTFPLPGACEYINIAKVRIRGFELEGFYDAGRVFAGLTATVLDGRDLETDEGLATVPPNRMTATVGFRAFQEAVDVGARVTLVGGKDDAEDFDYSGDPYQLLDLFLDWNIDDETELNFSINNVFDREYTQYLDLEPSPGLSARLALTKRIGFQP